MNEHEVQTQTAISELLETLQRAIESGPWDKSLFLMNIGKELHKLQEELLKAVNTEANPIVGKALSLDATQEVYVSLYHARGEHLSRWQSIIANLSDYCKNRPIYTTQTEVEAVTIMSAKPRRYAYAVVRVNPSDILNSFPEEKDRDGRALVTLREEAIQLKNIVRFVHISGEYKWVNGFLLKIDS